MKLKKNNCSGFTRIELFVVIITILLLVTVGSSHSFGITRKAAVSYCRYNLMQCYNALSAFSKDHEEKLPWEVSNKNGGSLDDLGRYKNNYKHWQVLSNYLADPRIVRCANDSNRRQATFWQDRKPKDLNGKKYIPFSDPRLSASVGNKSFSYFIASDSKINSPDYILAGGRNLYYGKYNNDNDSKGAIKRFRLAYPPSANIHPGWSASLHNGKGLLLKSGGGVTFINGISLKKILIDSKNEMNLFNLPAGK